ncbi:hypothetical protein TNCV_4904291 [Trichonephila clavipes]|nr:hypothetical protein TNCV_4904291 [Trichonephila clavipes]
MIHIRWRRHPARTPRQPKGISIAERMDDYEEVGISNNGSDATRCSNCAVLPLDASELTDEDEGNENDVNTGNDTVKDIPRCLEVRTGNGFQPEPPISSSGFDNKEKKQN